MNCGNTSGGSCQIAIHDRHRVPISDGEPGADGGLMPEIPGQMHRPDMRIARGQFIEDLAGAILAAIIDEHNFRNRARVPGTSGIRR